MDRPVKGSGGEIRVGYHLAGELGQWILEQVGPGMFRLRAPVFKARYPLFAMPPIKVWIPRGNLRWSWTLDDISVVDDALEIIVGKPTLGPLGG
jgi:hypothetical protein